MRIWVSKIDRKRVTLLALLLDIGFVVFGCLRDATTTDIVVASGASSESSTHGAFTYGGPAQVALHKDSGAEVRIRVSKLDLHMVTIYAVSALHTLVEVAQFAARVVTALRRDCKIFSTGVADQFVASAHVFSTSRITSSLSHTSLEEGNRVTLQALLLDTNAIIFGMSRQQVSPRQSVELEEAKHLFEYVCSR